MGVKLQGEDVTWLGHIAWYSVAADSAGVSQVKLDDLTSWADQLGVPLVSRPAPRTSAAFRSATSELSDRWTPTDGVTQELSVRQVRSNDDVVVRHIILTTTDSRRQHIEHTKVAEVKFHRPTRQKQGIKRGSERVTHRFAPDLEGDLLTRCERLVEQLQGAYAVRQEYVMVQTLRKVVRDLLDVRLEALALRRSGVYFIPAESAGFLPRVKELIGRFGPQAFLEYMPLVDSPQQRRMLADAFAAECADHFATVESVAAMEAEFGRDKPRRERLAVQQARLVQRGDYYRSLLGSERLEAHVHLGKAADLLAG